jgi:hypothetical protein
MLTFTVFFIATFGTAAVCYGLAALLGGGDDKL